MKAYNKLRDYVKLDDLLVDKTENSDFSSFCQGHCDDISEVCDCIKEILDFIDNISENDFDKYSEYKIVKAYMKDIKEIIEKVVD